MVLRERDLAGGQGGGRARARVRESSTGTADGSTWARLEPLGLQDKVLLRADGTAVYITQDIGTAIRKFEDYQMDRSLYVVGAEQEVHFRNLFAILRLLGHDWAGPLPRTSPTAMVNLARGMGKLKSREGTAVDADDLLDDLHAMARAKIIEAGYAETPDAIEATAEQIGQGALKLYILQVSPEKTIVFDPGADHRLRRRHRAGGPVLARAHPRHRAQGAGGGEAPAESLGGRGPDRRRSGGRPDRGSCAAGPASTPGS